MKNKNLWELFHQLRGILQRSSTTFQFIVPLLKEKSMQPFAQFTLSFNFLILSCYSKYLKSVWLPSLSPNYLFFPLRPKSSSKDCPELKSKHQNCFFFFLRVCHCWARNSSSCFQKCDVENRDATSALATQVQLVWRILSAVGKLKPSLFKGIFNTDFNGFFFTLVKGSRPSVSSKGHPSTTWGLPDTWCVTPPLQVSR